MAKQTASAIARPEEKGACCWLMYGLVGGLAIACYVNGLDGDFVHDDIPAVTLNKDVLAIDSIGRVFVNDFWGTPMAHEDSHKSYRPLTVLTFRVNFACFGLQPLWFHAANVLLHAVSSVLFSRVCLQVAGLQPPFATLAGLLFAVHPVHTEAVTGIVGRADVLACIFFLLSFLSYHGRLDGKRDVWMSVLLGAISMLAKETGVTVFLLNFTYDFYLQWPSVKKSLQEKRWNAESRAFTNRAATLSTATGLLLALRLAVLQGSWPRFSDQDNPAAFHSSMHVRFLSFCYLAAFNWWLLLCPATLSHDWQMGSVPLVTSWDDSRNLVTCFFFGLLLLLTAKTLSDLETQRHSPVVLGTLLLVVPFVPASNAIVTVGFVIAERVLYIPSLGCILLFAYGFQLLWNMHVAHRQTIFYCTVLLLLLMTWSLRTIARNRDWRSRETLLRAGIATLPQNAKMHYNYGNFLRDNGNGDLAKSHYYKALRLWPTYASAHNNLGTILEDDIRAEKHFLAAIRFAPRHVNAHFNLGRLYRKTNRSTESEEMLVKCISFEPTFVAAHFELAQLLKRTKTSVTFTFLRKMVDLNLRDRGPYRDALRSNEEAALGMMRTLRNSGQKSRLFQVVTRWFSVVLQRRDRHNDDVKFYDKNQAVVLTKSKVQKTSSSSSSSRNVIPLDAQQKPTNCSETNEPKTMTKSKSVFGMSQLCALSLA